MKKFFKEEEELSITDRLLAKEIEDIEVDKSVEDCVNDFLEPFTKEVEPYIYYSKAEKKLKYLLMKRFIFTAYNNLTEMDLDMSNSKVMTTKKDLMFVQKQYTDLNFQLHKPVDLTYEQIFLNKQKGFSSVLKEQESKRKTSELFKTRAKSAEGKMAELKDKASKYKSGSKDHEEIMKEYRQLNGSYTDYIHKMAVLRDEANFLGEFIVKFRSQHKITFSQGFNALGTQVVQGILSILDGLAYEFDDVLWEEARGSKIIKKYFEDAHVEGGFSSKTYLKYYLKNINEESENEEHKELRALLEYLESFSAKKIFILGNDNDKVSDDRYSLEASCKDYNIFAGLDPDQFYIETRKKPFDLLIIDFNLRNVDSLELIRDFWSEFPDIKNSVKILMLFDSPTYEVLNSAGRAGIKYFLRYDNTEKHRFINKVKEILN